MHGIIFSVIKGKEESIDIQIFDLEKAFDSLWLENCLSDVYDSLSELNRNDKLTILSLMNRTDLLGIRTPYGITERIDTPDIVQQGGIWGPTKCSNSIDSLGRKCEQRNKFNTFSKAFAFFNAC